ncbi:MAG: class I SAM-dependent methyltransferase [Solirubrobacterales bacterium]
MAETDTLAPALGALAQSPSGVEQEIAEGDEMYIPGRRELYFQLGAAALRAIRLALLAAGKDDPARILDFPCGHGRVLRMLKAEFPDAALTAGDLNADGVSFCARRLGATPINSRLTPEEVTIEGRFDLVWCGSLLTHLDRDRWPGFFSLLASAVDGGGVFVFTAYGRARAERIRSREALHGIGEQGAQKILSEFDRDGFGYADYEGRRLSGMSLTSPPWVCDRIAETGCLQLVSYTECGWHGQQDVVAVTKR